MLKVLSVCLGALVACSAPRAPSSPLATPGDAPPSSALREPAAFADIEDLGRRSVALFEEAGKVLQHPRCTNCHPSDDRPRQRDGEAHVPPVLRGPDGRGIAVLECSSCHTSRNAELARVPGAPGWHLAPRSMGWLGKDLAAICAQLKDPARNGQKTLAQIVDHAKHDPLVAWGWSPGAGRAPAPGTQARFGELIEAWVETGAHCPPEAP